MDIHTVSSHVGCLSQGYNNSVLPGGLNLQSLSYKPISEGVWCSLAVCQALWYVSLSQRKMRELVETGRYATHSNFTVVLQPFFRDVVLPLLAVSGSALHPFFPSRSPINWELTVHSQNGYLTLFGLLVLIFNTFFVEITASVLQIYHVLQRESFFTQTVFYTSMALTNFLKTKL